MVLKPDRAILAMMVGQTLIWAALFYSFVALVPAWQEGLGWSNTSIMAAFSLAAIIWSLVTPLTGRAIDRGWGPQLIPGAALCGAGLLVALAMVDTYSAFLIIWAGIGLTMAATLYEPAFAMVLRARGATARKGITAIAITAGFASSISYPIVHLVTEMAGWRAALLVMAVIAALLAAPLLALGARWLEAETPAAPPRQDAEGGWLKLRRLPNFVLVAMAFALAALVPGTILAQLFPLLDDRGVAPGIAVLAASMIGPAQVVGRLAVALIAPRASATVIVVAAMAALAVSALLMIAAARLPALIFVMVLFYGIGNGLVGIFRPVLARERYGEADIGAVAGALAGPALFVAALAPVAGALLADFGGYGLMLCTVAAAAGSGAVILLLTAPKRA
ncbi:MAG: MFS transporter [Pseudomonadota bacterium]